MSGWKYKLDICKFVQEAHRSKKLKVILDSLSLEVFTVAHLDHYSNMEGFESCRTFVMRETQQMHIGPFVLGAVD